MVYSIKEQLDVNEWLPDIQWIRPSVYTRTRCFFHSAYHHISSRGCHCYSHIIIISASDWLDFGENMRKWLAESCVGLAAPIRPRFFEFFLIFLGRFTSFLQWVPKSWKYPKKSKRREGADKATEDFFRDERKKIIMVTGNEDHDQNVVGHLCMNEPKKKDREKTKNKARTLWNYEICSPNQLRDSQTDTTAILAGETQKDRPRMDGHSIGTRPLRRGERNENCATASRWFISRYTFCLKIPPIFSFLFFFPEGIMAAIVTASGTVRYRTN